MDNIKEISVLELIDRFIKHENSSSNDPNRSRFYEAENHINHLSCIRASLEQMLEYLKQEILDILSGDASREAQDKIEDLFNFELGTDDGG